MVSTPADETAWTSVGPNSVERDKVVLQCLGYRQRTQLECLSLPFVTALYQGLVSAAVWSLPSLARHVLVPCVLSEAEYVSAKLIDGRQRLVQVEILYSHRGWPKTREDVKSQNTFPDNYLPVFRLFLRLYYYSHEHGTFVALPAMPWTIPGKIQDAMDCLRSIDQGGTWRLFNAGHQPFRNHTSLLFGPQAQPIRKSTLFLMSAKSALPTVFLIQYVELLYLAFTGYYIYSILLGCLTGASSLAFFVYLYKQYNIMMQLVQQPRIVPFVQSGWVRAISSKNLVPGDVIVLTLGKVTCDMVLLRGSCMAEESRLSGEAKQVRKSSYIPDRRSEYNPDSCHTCTVFAGTVVQQVWNAEDPDDEPLAMVVRTNYNTTMGSMARQLLAPVRMKQANPLLQACLQIYLYALVIQLLLCAIYLAAYRWLHPQTSTGDVLKRVCEMFIHAAPPGIPTVMMFCGGSDRGRLQRQGITVHAVNMLKASGEVEVVCFDKTGTLTGSVAKMHGIVPVESGKFGPLQSIANTWSNKLTQAAAACNGLIMINRSTVVGDDIESALFKTVEARFLDRKTVVLPRKATASSAARMATLKILRVLEFDSQTLKSGVVVTSEDAPPKGALLFVRGAPGAIKALVRPASVPEDFDQVRDEYSSKSFRLMATAVGVLHDVHTLDLPHMSLPEIEANALQLEMLSLIILSNQINPDSRGVINQLQQGGGIRTAMITGDYQHTAIAVARDVGMADATKPVLLIEAKRSTLTQTHLKPATIGLIAASQNSAFQSALYATTGQQRLPNAAAAGRVVGNTHFDDEHGTGEGISLEESAAIQHAPSSLKIHPALYCTRHVQFDTLQPQQQQQQQGKQQQETAVLHQTPEGAAQGHTPRPTSFTHKPMQPLSAGTQQLCSPSRDSDNSRDPCSSTPPEPPPVRLKFSDTATGQEVEQSQALLSLSEGRMQCAVTGDSFEQLLQQSDASVLEMVMRNAVVFARMKPHQKGQVMDLLGRRGIHQMFQGRPRHIQGLECTTLFCGDGINDLAALAAADVGMAVAASDAAIAASVSTTQASVAGLTALIRTGKSHGTLVAALIKFMIVYRIILSTAETIAYCMDGSQFDNYQKGTFDANAMMLALAAAVTPPLPCMVPRRPARCISNTNALTLLSVMFVGCQLAQGSHAGLLLTRPWYKGGNGTSSHNPANTLMFIVGIQQMLAPLVSLTIECGRFCKVPLSTKPMLVVTVIYVVLIQLVFLAGHRNGAGAVPNPLKLFEFPQHFRYQNELVLVITAVLYTISVQIARRLLDAKQRHRIEPV